MTNREPRFARTPVAFSDPDVAAAGRLILKFGRLALALIPGTPRDERTIARLMSLTTATNRVMAEGSAAAGLQVKDMSLAANYARDTHVRELLDEPWVRLWGALTIRLIVTSHTRPLAEHLMSAPLRLRPDARRIGAEEWPGAPKVKPMLRLYVAGGDCHLVAAQVPLVCASQHDRTDDRCDPEWIETAERELGETLPDTPASHVRLLLQERLSLARYVGDASGELFEEVGLDPAKIAEDAFPDLVILDAMPAGAPRVRGESYAQMLMPGQIEPVVDEAVAHGLSGIAACNRPPGLPRNPPTVALDPSLAAEFGITVASLDVVFGIIDDQHLLRVARSGRGTDSSLWRVFGMTSEDPRAAVLAQRAAEPWPQACIDRAEEVAPLGRIKSKHANWRRTMYALIALADAARVIAERARRAQLTR